MHGSAHVNGAQYVRTETPWARIRLRAYHIDFNRSVFVFMSIVYIFSQRWEQIRCWGCAAILRVEATARGQGKTSCDS